MPLDKTDIKKIRAPFPPESIQVRQCFRNEETGEEILLTGYKPQYIIERLNDCFGHEGWDFEIVAHDIVKVEAWVLGRLTVYASKFDKDAIDGPIIRKVMTKKEQFGTGRYNKGTSLGDTFKSAATNALEKCASLLDIGHEAYKGLVPVPQDSKYAVSEIDAIRSKFASTCNKYNVHKPEMPGFTKNILGISKAPKDLTIEEMNKLIQHLEKNKAPF